MFKLGGFKASFNLLSGKKNNKDQCERTSDVQILGVYRSNREDYYGNQNPTAPRKITPSMVKLPHTSHSTQGVKPSKSTSDLSKLSDIPQNVRKSTGDLASSTREHKTTKEIKNQEKEQRKLDKQKLAEQRKREKLAASEREKQEKLKREKFKLETQQKQQTQERPPKKEKIKAPAPQPQVTPLSQTPVPYSSNTLESSISRSTGPPPYSKTPEVIPNQNDNTGNTSFGKPVDGPSSWDLVSEHRQQLNRPIAASSKKMKSTVLDLGYNVGNMRTSAEVDNSEA
ncbi:unnamed protein product [Parnassius apollo]|uniref:(apollo) hypothetical protein n=1 Tax=Parnassius apollo TaxID=110799 RepID=A0A8S3X8W2_PARAO|nr:unnamed protein product [Parnassius apollo]